MFDHQWEGLQIIQGLVENMKMLGWSATIEKWVVQHVLRKPIVDVLVFGQGGEMNLLQ